MHKFLTCALICISLSFSACYKSGENNTARTTRTSDAATPVPSNTPPANTASTPSTDQPKGVDIKEAVNNYNAKKYERAEAAFKEIVKSEPNNAEAHFYLGKINAERKDYSAAQPYFEEAVRIDYKAPAKLLALGDNQRALKQFDRAIVQYQKVIGFEPNNAEAYYGLGLTYVGLNNKIAARQQLQKLEPLNKSMAEKLKKEIGD